MHCYEEIKALRDTKMSFSQIAKKLRISRGSVAGILQRGKPVDAAKSIRAQRQREDEALDRGPVPITLPVVRWMETVHD